jgi:hypothetical protein
MSTLVNLILAIVLQFYPSETLEQPKTIATQTKTKLETQQVYQLKDLNSNYVITKNEFIKSSIEIN